jgi:hypothetical protein
MSLERQSELLLESGSLGLSIPGLDVDTIAAKLLETQEGVKVQIEIIKEEVKKLKEAGEITEEEVDAKVEEEVKKVIDPILPSVKAYVVERKIIIEQQYKTIIEGLKKIPADVQGAIAQLSLPPTISAPPGVPNPLYVLIIAAQAKTTLNFVLTVMVSAFSVMVIKANEIQFVLPDSVLDLFEQIKNAAKLLDTIPV